MLDRNEKQVVKWLAGIDSRFGELAYNVVEKSGLGEFAVWGAEGDHTTDALVNFDTAEERDEFFDEHYALLIDAAGVYANSRATNPKKWLVELPYKDVPSHMTSTLVHTVLIHNSESEYRSEIVKGFLDAVIGFLGKSYLEALS